jgi:hypothetical protein
VENKTVISKLIALNGLALSGRKQAIFHLKVGFCG